MKGNLLLSLLAVTILLGLSSCSSEDSATTQSDKDMVTEAITVYVPSAFSTRAGDTYPSSRFSGYKNLGQTGTVYLSLYMYDKDGNVIDGNVQRQTAPIVNGMATFSFRGIPGTRVKYVGYATVGDKTLDSEELTSIPVTETLNDESQDCFTGSADAIFGSDNTLVLSRPVCKVRFIAKDYEEAVSWGVEVKKIEVVAGGDQHLLPYGKLNAMMGEYAQTTDVTSLSSETLPTYQQEDEYGWKTLFTTYIPVNEGESLKMPMQVNVTYTISGNTVTRSIKLDSGRLIPTLRRNRLVTIRGDVFFTTSTVVVIINDDLTEDPQETS